MRYAFALALAACGGGAAAPPDAIQCAPMTTVADGPLGAEVRVVATTPDPPARFTNDWTVTITRPDGTPAIASDVTVQPYMPLHGHVAPITPTVAETGTPGQLAIGDIDLWMPGDWEVRFFVATDRAVIDVCVPE